EERRIWRAFIAMVNRHPGSTIYHYGSYEPRAIEELAQRYDSPTGAIKNRLVNLSSHIFGNVYFPVRSNRLKDIGRFIGATWTASDPSGLQSLAWRYPWELTAAPNLKQTLEQYNKDDCQATLKLAECLDRIRTNAALDCGVEFAHQPKQVSN